MKFSSDDIAGGCHNVSRNFGDGGWERGEDRHGIFARYVHVRENDAGGRDYWSKGKKTLIPKQMLKHF